MPNASADQTVIRPAGEPTRRSLTLNRLLAVDHLPTPPAVAMQVVREASHPDVTSARISEILRQDPALCARVLKAINSVVYGMREQVTSVERAVLLLGLNAVRGLVLAISLPAMQASGKNDRAFRDFWQSAVSGAVISRELAVRLKVPTADDEMLAGLLRDIGQLLLQQAMPDEYAEYLRGLPGRPFSEVCDYEREVFGVDHAEATAELLARWNLPASLVEPIRHHHYPAGLIDATPDLRGRCERLGFVDALTHLDVVAQSPDEVDALLEVASIRYGLNHAELVRFLEGVMPKVEEFTALLKVDVGAVPNFAEVLARGSSELFMLTMESGTLGVGATVRTPPPAYSGVRGGSVPKQPGLLEFCPEFFEAFPAGGCSLDGLELRRVLGRGAMGVVFEGRDHALNRLVAVKMMLPELADDDRCRQRFIREARSVAAVRSPNVVAIHAVNDAGPFTYLCMEYVQGTSLADRIEQGGPLSPQELSDLASQLATGLAAAHAQRIVHRDVKPDNVLLDSVSGQAKLTDFGLAQTDTDVKLTTEGGLIGTPLYMSPEQATGRPVGPQSDLFSLGAVLYAAATGQSPFDHNTMFGVLKKVCEVTPPPPSTLRPDLPAWVDTVVLKLLAKAEADRFQTAEEVLAALAAPPAARSAPRAKKRWWLFGLG
ncbi:MAG: HDOD domain-containing protein [Fimbriiglobus sp.]|nr:HDOD domain-containing protein [Fimbriiglobus sp.]